MIKIELMIKANITGKGRHLQASSVTQSLQSKKITQHQKQIDRYKDQKIRDLGVFLQ